jgi:hypothetical protein
LRELPALLAELQPNVADIDGLELDAISRTRASTRPAGAQQATQDQRILHRVASMRSLPWLMKDVALLESLLD